MHRLTVAYNRRPPHTQLVPCDRAIAAVNMLKSFNTSPSPIDPDYVPRKSRHTPSKSFHQCPASPSRNAVGSDSDPTDRTVFTQGVDPECPPSPTLTIVSSEENLLIDLSDPDDHAGQPAQPDQSHFSDDFARLWNTSPPSSSSRDDDPADLSVTDIVAPDYLPASPTLRPSSQQSMRSSSTDETFYTSLSSQTSETKYISTLSEPEPCSRGLPPLAEEAAESYHTSLSTISSEEQSFSTTAAGFLPSHSPRVNVCLPPLYQKAAASIPVFFSAIPSEEESFSMTATEFLLPQSLRVNVRLPGLPVSSTNIHVQPTISLETKFELTEHQKLLINMIHSGKSSDVTVSDLPTLPSGNSSCSSTAKERLPPPHLRHWNRLPDTTTSSANTSFIRPDKSTPMTKAIKAVTPSSPIAIRMPHVTAPKANMSPASKETSSSQIIKEVRSPHLRLENRLSDDSAQTTKNVLLATSVTSRKSAPPRAKAKALVQNSEHSCLLRSESELSSTSDWATSNSWDLKFPSGPSSSDSGNAKISPDCYKSETVGPEATLRVGEMDTAMAIDFYARNVDKFCRNYTTSIWGCKWKDKCRKVHDLILRKAHMKQIKAQKKQSKAGKKNLGTSSDVALRNVTVKLEEMTQGNVKLPSSNTYSKTTYASTTATGLPPPGTVRKQTRKAWDQDELADWARSNLNPETVDKLMIPYILTGQVPSKRLYSPSTKGRRTFHQFGCLPGEIRNKIWRFAQLQGARDVRVRFTRHDAGNSIQPITPPPPLLLVNRESRSLAQLYWSTTFDNFENSCPASVYFHFNQDRLWIHNHSSYDLFPMLNLMKPQHAHYVRWISIPLREYVADSDDTMIALCKFKNVERIWFVVGDSREDDHWVRRCPPTLLNKKMKSLWALVWKDSWRNNRPPMCHLEIIPALEARDLKIDGLNWL